MDGTNANCEEIQRILAIDQKAVKFEAEKLEAMKKALTVEQSNHAKTMDEMAKLIDASQEQRTKLVAHITRQSVRNIDQSVTVQAFAWWQKHVAEVKRDSRRSSLLSLASCPRSLVSVGWRPSPAWGMRMGSGAMGESSRWSNICATVGSLRLLS